VTDPANVYFQARQRWDERHADLVVGKPNWQATDGWDHVKDGCRRRQTGAIPGLRNHRRSAFAFIATSFHDQQIRFNMGLNIGNARNVDVYRAREKSKMGVGCLAELVRMADCLGVERVSEQRREILTGIRAAGRHE
jgi:hypothetical protein